MTTKVKLECPDNSHWHVKVEIEDKKYNFDSQQYEDLWRVSESFVLKQTESRETYIHSSRRLIVSEIEPENDKV